MWLWAIYHVTYTVQWVNYLFFNYLFQKIDNIVLLHISSKLKSQIKSFVELVKLKLLQGYHVILMYVAIIKIFFVSRENDYSA